MLSALAGSETIQSLRRRHGGVPEWPKGTDCKSAGYAYGGSNPPAPTKTALISSKSGLFCNFSGHFAFQRMDEGYGEKQRQSKLARLRFSDSAPNSQVSENSFDPQLTHTRNNRESMYQNHTMSKAAGAPDSYGSGSPAVILFLCLLCHRFCAARRPILSAACLLRYCPGKNQTAKKALYGIAYC